MNEGSAISAEAGEKVATPFFEATDWRSFAATTFMAFLVYLFTLSPDVGLDFSGIFSTGAMYAGVPHPPGYPLWTVYGWVFTKLLPIGNIAWRLSVSSAIAAALICGVIALMVSRSGILICESMSKNIPLTGREGKWLRAVCGYVAGMIFGFNGAFWRKALIPDPWPLSMLCFCVVLCLLMRWLFAPAQKRFLYAASLLYGLTLTNSQMMLGVGPPLLVIVLLGNRNIGRDLLLAGSLFFVWTMIGCAPGWNSPLENYMYEIYGVWRFYVFFGLLAIVVAIALIVKTRGAFSEWKTVLLCGVLFASGLAGYFFIPVASMTNPPVNWGYARTPEGFTHTIRRGQYECMRPTATAKEFLVQLAMYARLTGKEFGWIYMLLALVPFLYWRAMPPTERKWIFTLLLFCLSSVLLILLVLNPDEHSMRFNKTFFSISYLVMAIGTGHGLIIAGAHARLR
jgi:hypothetical protein